MYIIFQWRPPKDRQKKKEVQTNQSKFKLLECILGRAGRWHKEMPSLVNDRLDTAGRALTPAITPSYAIRFTPKEAKTNILSLTFLLLLKNGPAVALLRKLSLFLRRRCELNL